MSNENNKWWKENFNVIVKLKPSFRSYLHNLLVTEGQKKAETYLWNRILDKYGLSMNNGLNTHLTYVGDSGYSLDSAWFEDGKVESKGNWGTVKKAI